QRVAVVPNHQDSNGWWAVLPDAEPVRRLTGRRRYRTAIIGAGICGLSVARRLGELRPGEPIALIEAERAGFGASGRNAGFLLDMHSHGQPKQPDVLRRNARLWAAGLEDLRAVVRDHQIQCDWSDWGRLYGSAGRDGEKHLDEIAEALDALEMPYEWRDRDRMRADLGTDFYLRGLHAPGNALVNPAAMVRGLARCLPETIDLFEETPVRAFERDGEHFTISTPDGEIEADQIVVAAGVFMKHLGIAPNRYVPMALHASLTEPIPEERRSMFGVGGEFGLLASSDNGATVRLTRDYRLFVRNVTRFAPETAPTRAHVAKAATMHRRAMLARWPDLADLKFEHSWGGMMAFTANNGAIFGEISPGLYAVLTHDVAPMTRGAVCGRLLAEYMEGQDSDLLRSVLAIPFARRLPPRPFLDLGVAWKLHQMRRVGAKEF
ncbi:MAG: FAD-binding oxidoreductase, partial [Alphaproteobacteria bacterium]|nr:FAD-binding oxidoreductase [Alphaproteobacteria bacterium]